jgi:hypothetical protein
MTLLLLALSLFGFGCCVVLVVVGANRSSRDCREWLQERQERELALQQRREEWVQASEDARAVYEADQAQLHDLNTAWALPVYERDGAER